jgi:flagellar basal body-associated protein FliL
MKVLASLLIFLLVMIMIVVGVGGSTGSSSSSKSKTAADAAEIGDIVTISYPASTIMCEDEKDSSTVYIVGQVALRQTMRLENSAFKAVDAPRAAQRPQWPRPIPANGHRAISVTS